MIETKSKTPGEIMEWLAGILCPGFEIEPGTGDWSGCDTEGGALTDCPTCHGTGRWLWRLVTGSPHAMRYEPQMGDTDARYECHYCGVPTPDVAVARRLDEQRCLKRPLVVRKPDLDILIDTGLDLGFASVFTPEAWDEVLPDEWITVRKGSKIHDLLGALVALAERQMTQNAIPNGSGGTETVEEMTES